VSSKVPFLLDLGDYERQTGFPFSEYIRRLEAEPDVVRIGTIKRKGIPNSVKAELWEKAGGRCYHCGGKINPFDNLHIDHLIPLSNGGADHMDNYVLSCAACNLKKGDK